jgi:hypothetical protein
VDNDAIVWDSSLRFSARTCIRMMTRIMQMIFANGLPIGADNQELAIML